MPNYEQMFNIDMIPVKENEEYDVPLSLFLPAYTIDSDDPENY